MSDLSFGMRSAEVGNWQRFLNTFVDSGELAESCRLVEDEDFDSLTRVATSAYQIREGVPVVPPKVGPGERAGVVGALTRKRGVSQGFIPFVAARNYTLVDYKKKPRSIGLIVIHTMESPGKPETAENVAAWFAGPNSPRASAHYCLDVDSTVQLVRDRDVAWHAKQANHNGIGIEHAGYAKQTAQDWDSPYNRVMLMRSAKLVAQLCRKYNIPIERRTADDLKSGLRGICGHSDVTDAFDKGIGHWDPGPHWPWQKYLNLILANG